MGHWLLKTEPETFGIDHLAALPRRTSPWDGVRNYQARNFLRDGVHKGDQAFLYHSSCAVPGIVGIVRVVRAAYPDATAFDRRNRHFDADSDPANPRWFAVDVQLQRRLKHIITLDELRTHAAGRLRDLMLLRRGNRLSVMPVDDDQWQFILSLE
jgi:predicted RNA-binding protein with PUA-like domain